MDNMIDGVTLHPLRHIPVPKGDIYHALKSTDDGFCGFGEVYFSEIKPRMTKGWKRHNRMTLNLVVVMGKIRFVIYDDRSESPTKGEFQEIILSPNQNYQRLTIAPGLWMAFHGEAEETSLLMDIIPQPHDPTEADTKDISEFDFVF